MHRLANVVFKGAEPFILGDSAIPGSEHHALIGEILLRTLEGYRPFPSRTLGISGLRSFNRLCQQLSVPAKEYTIQEEDWETLLRVCEWTLPRISWFRQAPAIMDMLEEVRSE